MSPVYDWVWTYAKLIGFLAATYTARQIVGATGFGIPLSRLV